MRNTGLIATRDVAAITPPAAYVGGKRNLASRLITAISDIPHDCYAEPFFGMGGVFLRRTHAAKSEIINDGSRDVITFFRVLQRHYSQFIDVLKFYVASRVTFEEMLKRDTETLTDLERATRFFYLQRLSFGGKVTGRSFAGHSSSGSRFRYHKIEEELEALHTRLADVIVECLPYGKFIQRYDTPGTLFYIDPPYWGTEHYYGQELFARGDFERLAHILGGIKGRFVLSINDRVETRRTFSSFSIKKVKTKYSLASNRNGQMAGELIVSNT